MQLRNYIKKDEINNKLKTSSFLKLGTQKI